MAKRGVVALAVVALAGCSVGDDESERALPTSARVILRDDFSDPASGWATGEDANDAQAYANGRYQVRVKENDWYISDSLSIDVVVEAMRLEVDALQAEGEAADEIGVVCYAHEAAKTDAGYALIVSPADGWAGIYRRLEKAAGLLEERWDVNHLRPVGSVNRIRADCIGATRADPAVILLYVNGKLVVRAEDDEGFPRFDGVGVTTSNGEGGALAYYDNLVVSRLN